MTGGRATFFSASRLAEPYTPAAVVASFAAMQFALAGAGFFRATVVSPTLSPPAPGYPHGLYLEGWAERPEALPPFDFPMSAVPAPDSAPPPKEQPVRLL